MQNVKGNTKIVQLTLTVKTVQSHYAGTIVQRIVILVAISYLALYLVVQFLVKTHVNAKNMERNAKTRDCHLMHTIAKDQLYTASVVTSEIYYDY